MVGMRSKKTCFRFRDAMYAYLSLEVESPPCWLISIVMWIMISRIIIILMISVSWFILILLTSISILWLIVPKAATPAARLHTPPGPPLSHGLFTRFAAAPSTRILPRTIGVAAAQTAQPDCLHTLIGIFRAPLIRDPLIIRLYIICLPYLAKRLHK